MIPNNRKNMKRKALVVTFTAKEGKDGLHEGIHHGKASHRHNAVKGKKGSSLKDFGKAPKPDRK